MAKTPYVGLSLVVLCFLFIIPLISFTNSSTKPLKKRSTDTTIIKRNTPPKPFPSYADSKVLSSNSLKSVKRNTKKTVIMTTNQPINNASAFNNFITPP